MPISITPGSGAIATGDMHCGLLDWGMVRPMNLGIALWGGLSAASPDLWRGGLDPLLALFAEDLPPNSGGPTVEPAQLALHFDMAAAMMGLALMLDAPALIRSAPAATMPRRKRPARPGIARGPSRPRLPPRVHRLAGVVGDALFRSAAGRGSARLNSSQLPIRSTADNLCVDLSLVIARAAGPRQSRAVTRTTLDCFVSFASSQ